MPSETKVKVYNNFLYAEFTGCFKKYFEFYKPKCRYKYARYSWDDKTYQDFMLAIYHLLNPIMMPKGFTIINELEDVGTINFIMHGEVKVGFEVNKEQFLRYSCVSLPVSQFGYLVGGFECLNNCRSTCIYRANTKVKGFFMKKLAINNLIKEFPEFMSEIRARVTRNYIKMMTWINLHKKKIISKFEGRADYTQVLVIKDNDPTQLAKIVEQAFIKPGHTHEQLLIEECIEVIKDITKKYIINELKIKHVLKRIGRQFD